MRDWMCESSVSCRAAEGAEEGRVEEDRCEMRPSENCYTALVVSLTSTRRGTSSGEAALRRERD
mgnify:CR=1 FL=1